MATAVYTAEEVKLQDDTDVILKPNRISVQKKFRKEMTAFGESKTEDEGLEVLLKATAICLSKQRPEFWDNDKETYTEAFEEALDEQTMYRVLDVCGGTKFGDPKVLAEMEAKVAEAISGSN